MGKSQTLAKSEDWLHDHLEPQLAVEGAQRNRECLQGGGDGGVVVQDVGVGADLAELHDDLQMQA